MPTPAAFALALSLLLSGCVGALAKAPTPSASGAEAQAPAPSAAPSATPPVGGYTAQDPKDEASLAVMREAEKLVQAKHPTRNFKLTQLASIQSQVVAGTNFRLMATYTDASGSGSVNLVVFRSLQGEFSLSESDYQAAP